MLKVLRYISIFLPFLLVSCGISQLHDQNLNKQGRVLVKLRGFFPHRIFDGNQSSIWVAYDFEIIDELKRTQRKIQSTKRTLRVVDMLDSSDDFDLNTLEIARTVSQSRCPILHLDETKYELEIVWDAAISNEIAGAVGILKSCKIADLP